MRGALGRRNYLFMGTDSGGERATAGHVLYGYTGACHRAIQTTTHLRYPESHAGSQPRQPGRAGLAVGDKAETCPAVARVPTREPVESSGGSMRVMLGAHQADMHRGTGRLYGEEKVRNRAEAAAEKVAANVATEAAQKARAKIYQSRI